MAEDYTKDQATFENTYNLNPWKNSVKREEDTESEEEESNDSKKKRSSYKRGVNPSEIEEIKLELNRHTE